MKIFKSKRGSDIAYGLSWSKLWNIIFAVFIFITVYTFVLAITNSEYFDRSYLNMDVALAAETALASPNDMIYLYDKNMKSFSLDIQEKSISVYKKENNIIDANVAKSYYINDPSKNIEYGDIDPVYEKDNTGKQSVIPLKLVITSIKKKVKAYNANEINLN